MEANARVKVRPLCLALAMGKTSRDLQEVPPSSMHLNYERERRQEEGKKYIYIFPSSCARGFFYYFFLRFPLDLSGCN